MDNNKNQKPSFSAILMYLIIGIAVIISAVCFTLYYESVVESDVFLWTAITCFTITYHLGMRLIMGLVTKALPISYKGLWFRELPFEKKLYRILKVKKWKDKALTFEPELYDIHTRTLTQIANTTAKSETDHWINVLISTSTLLFALVWGAFPIFLISAVLSALFDMQFIIIQRYNRPRIIRMIKREGKQKSAASI